MQTEVWYGALVSVKAPAPVVQRLQAATLAVQNDPATQKVLRQHGIVLGEPGADGVCEIHPSGDRALDADRHHHQDAVTLKG